jgi:apolipoprotein N-acyltransferase
MSRLRAVETRRWLVRASGSGISAVIDPRGEIVASLPYGDRGTLRATVALRTGLTPYVRDGDWVVWLSGVIVLGEALRRARRMVRSACDETRITRFARWRRAETPIRAIRRNWV